MRDRSSNQRTHHCMGPAVGMQRSLTAQAARNDHRIGTRPSRKVSPFPTRYSVVTQDTRLCLSGNLHRADHGGGRETTIRDKDEIDRSDSRRIYFLSMSETRWPLPGTNRIRDPDRGETLYPELSRRNSSGDKLCHRDCRHEPDSVVSDAEFRSQLSQVTCWVGQWSIHTGVRIYLMIDNV